MSVAPRLRRVRRPRAPAVPPPLRDAALLVVLLAVSGALRTTAIGSPLWGDEALSIGVASHPVLDIPGVLVQDGSPPLYYLLLHGWMELFGRTETATHALSVVFALGCIPAAWRVARGLFGARAGWVAATLAAVNPFLTAYAQESRMYALVVLLALVASGAFAQVFALRDRRYLVVFAIALAALLYTHNWGLFLGAGAAIALGVLMRGHPERNELLRDGLIGFGGAGLLFLPWLPTLAGQAAETGAPWVNSPKPAALLDVWGVLLGDDRIAIALLLGGGAAVWASLRHPRTTRDRALLALALIPVATLLVAWSASQFSPAWTVRYQGAALGALLLLAAAGLAASRRAGLAVLALVLVLSATSSNPQLSNKANADDVATEVRPALRPGDLVVSTQPEQTALMAYYLPRGLRQASVLGPVADPGVMDWRNALARLRAARPASTLEPLLREVRPGQRVLLVRPNTEAKSRWTAPWTRLVRRRSAQWGDAMAADRRFVRAQLAPRFYRGAGTVGVRAVLYTRR